MKKILLLVLICGYCFGADVTLTYTFTDVDKDANIARYVRIHPNNELDGEGAPLYTDAQWVKEHILRYIKIQLRRGNKALQRDADEAYTVSGIN